MKHDGRDRGPDPVADRVAPERGAHGELLEVVEGGRQRPGPQDLGELVGLLGGEAPAPGDAVVRPQPALDDRRRLDAVVEDDGELAADVAAGLAGELGGRGGVEGEVDLGPVVLVHPDPGVLQVAAGDHRLPPDQVVDPLAGVGARAAEQLHVVGDRAAVGLEERLLAGSRVLDQLERELGGGADDALGLLHVGDAGQLHQDLVAAAAVLGDHRLGDAELVDAALEGANRLLHRAGL